MSYISIDKRCSNYNSLSYDELNKLQIELTNYIEKYKKNYPTKNIDKAYQALINCKKYITDEIKKRNEEFNELLDKSRQEAKNAERRFLRKGATEMKRNQAVFRQYIKNITPNQDDINKLIEELGSDYAKAKISPIIESIIKSKKKRSKKKISKKKEEQHIGGKIKNTKSRHRVTKKGKSKKHRVTKKGKSKKHRVTKKGKFKRY